MTALDARRGTFRPDIEGLRALAVLAVVVFHIDPAWLPGGFVGVDIFFVISGFLITGIISREIESGRFRFAGFYERRMRRILPALWVLLAVCVPVSWMLMLPADAESMGKSAVWSVAAMANVYFWRDASNDYFAPQSAQMPFLHLWSVGVEEQFYLLWPLLLFLLWRIGGARGRKSALVVATVLALACTILADWLLAMKQFRFAYYMLPARAGELALGGALALGLPSVSSGERARAALGNALAAAGWGLTAASLAWLNADRPFPGWHALVPTLGAAAFIVSGQLRPGGILLAPLLLRPIQWLGRCSYSAYLWHWPILAWWRYVRGEPSTTEGLLLLALVLALAGASERWIERPVRHARADMRRTFLLVFAAPAGLLLAMALLVVRGETWGLPLYSPAARQEWQSLAQDVSPTHRLDWVCQQRLLDPAILTAARCEVGAGPEPARAFLFGDSHAAEFAPLIRRAAETQGVRIRSVALGSCAPLDGPLHDVVRQTHVQRCEEGMSRIVARTADFDLLIIGAEWSVYGARAPGFWTRLEAQLRDFTERGQTVWLLPRVPQVTRYDPACAAKSARLGGLFTCPTTLPQTEPDNRTNRRLAELARRVPGVRYLPFDAELCTTPDCRVVDEQGRFIYSEASHLSAHGALVLAERLERKGLMPDLRAIRRKPGP